MLWTDKYSPKKLDEIAGNEEAKQELLKWALEFEKVGKAKPVLLSGPVGVGKTTLARCLALQMGWEMVESDASRIRSAKEIKDVLGASAGYSTLWGSRRLVVVDEIGTTSDRSSAGALVSLAKESSQPLLFIANDPYEKGVSPLRFLTKPVDLRKVNSRTIAALLKKIARAEGMPEGEYLGRIAASCGGDVRAAITDLQSLRGFEGQVEGFREREEDVFEAIRKTLKAESYAEAVSAADGLDQEISAIVLWLSENVPIEYELPQEVARAFEALSEADIFLGAVRRSSSYSFWRYARVLALAGTALAKEKKYFKFSKYAFPSRMRRRSASAAALKQAAIKVGQKTHSSSRRARRDTLPFLASAKSESEFYSLEPEESEAVREVYGKLTPAVGGR